MDWCNRYWINCCGNWMCRCLHKKETHALGICLVEKCECKKFIFLHNDLCSLECIFYKKIVDCT